MSHRGSGVRLSGVILGLWLAGCAALSGPAGATNDAANACAQQSTGAHAGTLRHGVLEREYSVYLPASAPAQQRSLLVGLHGGWGTGDVFAEQAGLRAAADASGLVLLLPEGKFRSWNAGRCCGPAAERGVDDVGFLKRLVQQVAKDYCVAPERVVATGFSNGAMLVHRIRCEHPELFAAIAPVSGGPMMDACKSGRAVPALLIQGREDERIFWDGGEFDGSYRPAMREVVAALGRDNGCAEATRKNIDASAQCETMQCTQAPLTWCGVPRVGHQWPGGKSYWPGKLGPNRDDVDATQMILRFFQAQLKTN